MSNWYFSCKFARFFQFVFSISPLDNSSTRRTLGSLKKNGTLSFDWQLSLTINPRQIRIYIGFNIFYFTNEILSCNIKFESTLLLWHIVEKALIVQKFRSRKIRNETGILHGWIKYESNCVNVCVNLNWYLWEQNTNLEGW